MKRIQLILFPVLAIGVACLVGCGGGSNDASIGGTLSGLVTGQNVVLQNNNADGLTVTANGSFRFATSLASSASYSVTVLTQPTGEICQIANGTGQVNSAGDDVTSVAVACVTTSSVGGTVSGLTAGTAVTLSNGTVLLPVATNGPFTFPGALVEGTPYQIAVATQPLGLLCTVTNGVGTVNATSQTAVTVSCS